MVYERLNPKASSHWSHLEMISGILLSGTECSVAENPGVPDTGQTVVAEWKDNKSGALSLAFDIPGGNRPSDFE